MLSRNPLIGVVSSVVVPVATLGLLVLLDETTHSDTDADTDTDSRTSGEPGAGRTTTHADLTVRVRADPGDTGDTAAVVALVEDLGDGLG